MMVITDMVLTDFFVSEGIARYALLNIKAIKPVARLIYDSLTEDEKSACDRQLHKPSMLYQERLGCARTALFLKQ